MASLHERYTTIQPKLSEQLGIANSFAIPRIQKITLNVGLGDIKGNEPLQKSIVEGLGLITSQKPIPTRSKTSIAGFKLREGDMIGYKVTLRGQRMYEFLERMITYVFPRLRDFHGFEKKGLDAHGNYSFGLREHTVFPEIPFESATRPWSMQITITTSAKDKAGAEALLEQLGFPFTKPKGETK